MKTAGLSEILNTINKLIACKKVSGILVPVINRKITKRVHFESQIYPTTKAASSIFDPK
jgi:hypothetical protein